MCGIEIFSNTELLQQTIWHEKGDAAKAAARVQRTEATSVKKQTRSGESGEKFN